MLLKPEGSGSMFIKNPFKYIPMTRDYSSMSITELEKEIAGILRTQHRQDDLFRLAVLVGQLDLAKFIYHDKEYQPDTRHVKGMPKSGETAAYGQALAQLLLLMKARRLDFERVFRYAIEHMKDDEYKARRALNGNGISGYSVADGRVRGKAYVVSADSPLERAPEGSIIVMEHADSGTIECLSNARAVVTDQGGRLSHLAIMARERGMPAVIGTGNATSLIKTGETILVDADQGSVKRL
jgi:phosphohistidine swiveling domain-containing protein